MASVRDLQDQIITSVQNRDIARFKGLLLNPDELDSLDEAIFYAPENGELKFSEFYRYNQALTEWPDMRDFISEIKN